jgi:uncharacterized protein (DUF983 family)
MRQAALSGPTHACIAAMQGVCEQPVTAYLCSMNEQAPTPPAKKPSYWWNVFTMGCPRCREGKLFKNKLSLSTKKNLAMHKACVLCGQPTEIEVGFYYGTGYVSYGITVLFTAASFVAWLLLIGISVDDNRIFYWLFSNALLLILLQPWLMRFSRSLWLSWFVKYDPQWRTRAVATHERIIADQMEGRQDIDKATLE